MGKIELKIEIDADLLAKGQAAGIDMARTLENGIRQATNAGAGDARAQKWAEENAEAIADYNRRIRERGLIGDEFRNW